MRKLLAIAAAVALSACGPDKTSLARDVEAYGFTDVQIGGWAWFECAKDDDFAFHFTATNAAGRRVKGAVCKGWLKGSTVRITG